MLRFLSNSLTTALLAAAFAFSPPPAAASDAPALARVRVGLKNLPAAADWFSRVLHWTPDYRGAGRVEFSSATAALELVAADADCAATLVLASADVDADHRLLLSRGARELSAPDDKPDGRRESSVRGPGALTVALEGPLARPPGFSVTPIREGSGLSPRPTDTVKVHYVGKLADGSIFDDSHRSGIPAMIPLESAVRCWPQALTRMRVGESARVVCPPETAYGHAGRPPRIPPDATLVFDIDLLGIIR